METQRLDKDFIVQPELWRMVLMVSENAVDVALYPPVAREEMIWRRLTWNGAEAVGGLQHGLVETVYDNPLLLCNFKHVECIVDYGRHCLLPKASEEDCKLMLSADGEEEAMAEAEFYDTGFDNATAAVVQDEAVKAFLLRTFFNIKFDSRMAVLCRYFSNEGGDAEQARVYALVDGGRLTVVACRGKQLLMANDFKCGDGEMDAAYYILSSMHQLDLDATTTRVQVMSIGEPKPKLMEVLGRYVVNVGQLPFPTLRYKASKSTLHAPFEFLIKPLCE